MESTRPSCGSTAAEAKAVALELAYRHTGLNQRQIGRHYGNITSMAVCMARRRFRKDQAERDPALQKRLARLEKEILAESQLEYLESDPVSSATPLPACQSWSRAV